MPQAWTMEPPLPLPRSYRFCNSSAARDRTGLTCRNSLPCSGCSRHQAVGVHQARALMPGIARAVGYADMSPRLAAVQAVLSFVGRGDRRAQGYERSGSLSQDLLAVEEKMTTRVPAASAAALGRGPSPGSGSGGDRDPQRGQRQRTAERDPAVARRVTTRRRLPPRDEAVSDSLFNNTVA
jgi:hypothetical protein